LEAVGQALQAHLRRAAAPRYAILLAIALVGIIATLLIWWSAMKDSNRRAAETLSSIANESHSVMNSRVDRHISATRNLALYWQLYGLQDERQWQFHTQMMLSIFRSIDWIAWVNGQTGTYRFGSSDSTATIDPELLRVAREHGSRPGSQFLYPERVGESFFVFQPVRTPDDSVGVMVAALAPSRLLGREMLGVGETIAYTVLSQSGEAVFRTGEPALDVPEEMVQELSLSEAFGPEWKVRYEPTEGFLRGTGSKWHNFFLLTGVLLSVALGAIAFQFMSLREYSEALTVTNRRLDAQVRELSERDLKLRKMNDELETRVDARTTQLLEAVTELEAFSHSISHDLRSPVGAVLNYAAILQEDYGDRLDPEGLRLLKRIQDCGQAATRLLNQMMQFVWREEGEKSDVNMTEVAREAYAEVVTGQEDTQDVSFDLQPLPSTRGNAALMGRVFRNLIGNSVKYTRGREGRRIEVHGEERDKETVYYVSDNGIGFDPAAAESLFEPFLRLQNSKEYDGAGLGLAIVAKIVRKHGGRAWAESDGISGARFAFALPRQENGA
jgi:signal transduction histidine kinase